MKRDLIWYLTVCTVINNLEAATALDYYRYFFANYNQYRNKSKDAHRWYKKLLRTKAPSSIYKGYLDLLFRNGEMQQIVNLIPKLDQYFEHDADIQLIFAQALARTGNVKAADERLIRASMQHKTHQELVFYAAQSYMRRKEPENALSLINSLLDSTPRVAAHYVFYFLKSQIHTILEQYDEALVSIKKSVSINPSFEKGRLVHALLQEKGGNRAEAIKAYEQAATRSRSPLLKRQILHHLTNLKGDTADHKSASVPVTTESKHRLYGAALEKVNAYLDTHPKDTKSRIFKLQLLAAKQEYAHIVNLLKGWIQEEPTVLTWYELLYQLAQKHDINKIIAVLNNQERRDPNNPLVLTYLGALYNRADKPHKSLAYFKKAYSKTTDKQLKTKIAFQQALIYHDQHEYTPMLAVLEAAELLGLNYPPLLNMLAYSYAKQNRNLDKANQLINQVLQADSTNPYYLDTQALIFYAQHEYSKAHAILEKLAQDHPTDTTILSHFSKVLVQEGHKEQAKDILKNALKVAKGLPEQKKFKSRLDALALR